MKLSRIATTTDPVQDAQRGLLALVQRRLKHELSELLESLTIEDSEVRDRFIRGRVHNILQFIDDQAKSLKRK